MVAEPRGASVQRSFRRDYASLREIFDFIAGFFSSESVDPSLRRDVDFSVEELFTNMVKYSTESSSEIRLELCPVEDGVEVVLTDFDVEPFDVTRAPESDVDADLAQRRPGGLGLQLVKKLVDEIEYQYSPEERSSRIRFTKTRPAH